MKTFKISNSQTKLQSLLDKNYKRNNSRQSNNQNKISNNLCKSIKIFYFSLNEQHFGSSIAHPQRKFIISTVENICIYFMI